MNQFITFPKNFWWGAATSGPQSEGTFEKKHLNIMDYWHTVSPEDFFDQVGPETASDFYHHVDEDLEMLKSIGFNSFRTSIQWTRMIKDFETGEVDPQGVAFYKHVIQKCKELDIKLILNLHHFDLPIELMQKYGGWHNKKVVDLFVKFAKACFEEFGHDVAYWTTFNEPMVIIEGGYFYGFHYPKKKGHGTEGIQALYNINLASAKVIQLYHDMHLGGEIGIILNLTPAYPRSQDPKDLEASRFTEAMFNNSFLDPAIKGTFPQLLVDTLKKDGVLWESTEEELDIIRNNHVDYLGVNYYHPKRVKAPEERAYKDWMPDWYFEEWQWPECRMNPYRGWEIYPKAIYDIAKNIQENYGNIKWYISENGMGVENEEKFKDESGMIIDDYRIDFYKEHLAYLKKAIDEGANCFGYHAWTSIDCWSWANAYKNRYGFISLDLKTQERTIKKSGYWFKELSDHNGYTYDLDIEIK